MPAMWGICLESDRLKGSAVSAVPRLVELRPHAERLEPDQILDAFLDWVGHLGFELYPAQEEALLELYAGRHVILNTPTGSGKSLVALGLHFRDFCLDYTSFYTSPIKALASEKFFSICQNLGAENVGMLTGDASINSDGNVLCCTAEVLANLALRRGRELAAESAVLDEFHYYGDRDRGVAWQIPLITLPDTQFLLMSATLGDMRDIANRLETQSGREVALITAVERPVPLDFAYVETALHESVASLAAENRTPIYIVNFTQRECSERAQGLTSMDLTTREEKAAIREAIAGARFDTPYGREFKRFLGFGIGIHHAGLLPKYRLMVEQLAQQGLLKVISGTDTLGVGVNIPIRTVLFSQLAKYDGRKTTLLKVRDFQQIAGRAGRKGFDEQGSVVSLAPEHIIERRQAERKAARTGSKKKPKFKQPPAGTVSWDEKTLNRLITSQPEQLRSRFRISAATILDLLQRDALRNDPEAKNFQSLRHLIEVSHEDAAAKQRHRAHAAQLVRSLYRSGIIRMTQDTEGPYKWVVVDDDLQIDFSLYHHLSLFLFEALELLDRADPDYALDVVSLVEAVLEDPAIIIRRQLDQIKTDLIARLKAEGVSYEERMARLDEVVHPQPRADFISSAYARFREEHRWVGGSVVSPKSIGREMIERYATFGEYVRDLGLQRFEGVLLRYLSQLYKTLVHNVPDTAKTEPVHDVIAFFRALLERVDTSLIEEWESLLHPELRLQGIEDSRSAHRILVADQLARDPVALMRRVRAEMHQLVRALSARDWEEAASCVRLPFDVGSEPWTPERFQTEMTPYFDQFSALVFDHRARLSDKTTVTEIGERTYRVTQALVDPEEDGDWCIEGEIDLGDPGGTDGPLVLPTRIGP